jgi:hypothetical protein
MKTVTLPLTGKSQEVALVANTSNAITYDLLTLDLVLIDPDALTLSDRRRMSQVV